MGLALESVTSEIDIDAIMRFDTKLDPALRELGGPEGISITRRNRFPTEEISHLSILFTSDSKVSVARHFSKIGLYTDKVQNFLISVSSRV